LFGFPKYITGFTQFAYDESIWFFWDIVLKEVSNSLFTYDTLYDQTLPSSPFISRKIAEGKVRAFMWLELRIQVLKKRVTGFKGICIYWNEQRSLSKYVQKIVPYASFTRCSLWFPCSSAQLSALCHTKFCTKNYWFQLSLLTYKPT
jgi:hypothetical protein